MTDVIAKDKLGTPVLQNGIQLLLLLLTDSEHRLRVFENRVLGKIFGSEREEGIGGWRRL
jgi:hypothetical protein